MSEYILVETSNGRLTLYIEEGEPILMMEARYEHENGEVDWVSQQNLAEGTNQYDLFLELVAAGQGEPIPDWKHLK